MKKIRNVVELQSWKGPYRLSNPTLCMGQEGLRMEHAKPKSIPKSSPMMEVEKRRETQNCPNCNVLAEL